MNYRLYGQPKKIILHGGPGAIGSVSALAKTLGDSVELLNEGQSIEAQLNEIKTTVEHFNMGAPILIGHSWGAWLAYIYASKYPVSKIILIGCGAFQEKYLPLMNERRDNKLSEAELKDVDEFFKCISKNQPVDMSYFGKLMTKMDSYDLEDVEDHKDDQSRFDEPGHKKLMAEIRPLRKSGALLDLGQTINTEVIVIHGKQDPHPYEGITEPFDLINLDHTSYILDKCGHTPWCERHAKETFYTILKKELNYKIKTDRLGLREFKSDDSKWFADMNQDQEVMNYFPSALNKEASDLFLKRIMTRYNEYPYGLYVVEVLESRTPIGFVGLSTPTFEAEFLPATEIGWRLKSEYWRNGYTKEAAEAVLKYAFNILKLNEIVSFTSVINKPSIAVMNSINLSYIKTFDHPNVVGPLRPHVLYKLERTTYEETKTR